MVADNPDSGFAQTGLDLDFASPNMEEISVLFGISPIRYVKRYSPSKKIRLNIFVQYLGFFL